MSNDNIYREVLLDRLEEKINEGKLLNPDFSASLVNPLCGDEVLLQLKVKEGLVEQAVYSGNGCAISQVSASLLTELVEGKKLLEVRKIKSQLLLNKLGVKLGPSRLKCATLPLEALKQAIR